jgi:Peptidase family S41
MVAGKRHEETRIVRAFDVEPLRGSRVMVTIRARLERRGDDARAIVRVAAVRPATRTNAWDKAEIELATPGEWKTISVIQDVADDASALQVRLVVNGNADAWFSDLVVTVLPRPTIQHRVLIDEEIARLRALATLAGYLRFFHPSDQSAHADWHDLEVRAVDRLLSARDRTEAQAVLVWLTATVAPTAELYPDQGHPTRTQLPMETGAHLTRWRHYGLQGSVYASFRDGLDEMDDVNIHLSRTIRSEDLAHCHTASLESAIHVTSGQPLVEVDIIPQSGFDFSKTVSRPLNAATDLHVEVPAETTLLSFGLTMHRHGAIDISQLTLLCDGKRVAELISETVPDVTGLGAGLYHLDRGSMCGTRSCFKVSRDYETMAEVPKIDREVGLGLRLQMPVAAWTKDGVTLPHVVESQSSPSSYASADFVVRIATALDLWLVLRWFYPYFDDLHIDWSSALAPAMQASAQAASAAQQELAIHHLIAGIHDGHAGIKRFGREAVLPFLLHNIDGTLVVTKALAGYEDLLPRGSIIMAIDGTPIGTVLRQLEPTVSAATLGLRDYFVSLLAGAGQQGELASVKARTPVGKEVAIVVPRVGGSEVAAGLREPHPKNGDEVTKGVIYLDLHTLDVASLTALIPKLAIAKAIIFDLRGYITAATWDIVAHLIDRAVTSPIWQIPVITPDDAKNYDVLTWTISPKLPRFSGQAIFLADGQTVSAAETILQMVRAYDLGFIVGETSAGTNGNIASYDTIGGISVSFTGMRALNPDGTLLHGHGIIPDLVVHPTIAGIAANKDEVLEAAIKEAAKRGHDR